MGLILDLPRVELHMPPALELDDDVFFAICQANPDYRIERTARGDIQIMPPTGGVTGRRNSDLNAELNLWARRDGRGVAFDSSTGFILSDEEILPGFTLDLAGIWSTGF
jgi:Uma2 family endonuclease